MLLLALRASSPAATRAFVPATVASGRASLGGVTKQAALNPVQQPQRAGSSLMCSLGKLFGGGG